MTTYEMPLSFTRPPLNMNDRMHWAKKAKIVKSLRHEAFTRAKAMKLPTNCGHIEFQFHFMPRDNRRRDAGNLLPNHKALLDGIVDAWVVHDDNPDYVTELMPKIHPPERGQLAKCWLTIKIIR